MLNKIQNFIIREGKILAVSLVIGLVFAISVDAYTYVYSQNAQKAIADNVIRFHVQANSDNFWDQELKELVRTEVLAEFEPYLSSGTCVNGTRKILAGKLGCIEYFAQNIVKQNGSDHRVTAKMARTFFPTRFYGNMSFPPGEYEAVQIIIGEGAGRNWWCLMFPPLCYVDMTATNNSRQQLENTVPEQGFRLLMHQEEQSTGLRVRFRVVEWWQNRGKPAAELPLRAARD